MTDQLPPTDRVPRPGRPDRETVLRLLGMAGQQVTLINHELTEDGVTRTETPASFIVTCPEQLGWTWDELGITPTTESDEA